jgi:endo-1,3-1,4-beta-glycanase ExoK
MHWRILFIISVTALTACSGGSAAASLPQSSNDSVGAMQVALSPTPSQAPSIDLSNWNNTTLWKRANNYANTGWDNDWNAQQAVANGADLTITLDNIGCPTACVNKPYKSDEMVSASTYGYGLYEVDMQTANVPGLNTAFFTYIDPTGQGLNDEIDVEILSKNPSQLSTNFYTKGKDELQHTVNLGFDSSAALHHYGINWTPNAIQWFVDGKVVWSGSATQYSLPTTPTKMELNLWTAGSLSSWLGPFTYTGPVHAYYANAKFTPYVPST